MSGFVYSIHASGSMLQPRSTVLQSPRNIEYIDNARYIAPSEEAAGGVGKFLGVIAAIAIPFAAPMVFGALAGSGGLLAGLGLATSGGYVTGLAGVLGSAVVGGIMNAGVAYLNGARGGDVWRAAGMGALSGGIGGLAHIAGGAQAAANAAGTGVAATGGTPSIAATSAAVPGSLSGMPVGAGTVGAGAGGSLSASGTLISAGSVAPASSGVMHSITSLFGNISAQTVNRIGAVITNAAVNGQSLGRLDGLVAQQKAELATLKARDLNAYNQKISAAQQIMAAADRADPQHTGLMRMADVAGMEANQFKEAMRNIAVRSGGSLDSGQRNAYERGSALHTARSKALAYNQGVTEATGLQNTLRAQGAQLLGPDEAGFENWKAGVELDAAKERAHREADNSTSGSIISGLFGEQHDPATSPDPSATQTDDTSSTVGSFWRNVFHPIGGHG